MKQSTITTISPHIIGIFAGGLILAGAFFVGNNNGPIVNQETNQNSMMTLLAAMKDPIPMPAQLAHEVSNQAIKGTAFKAGEKEWVLCATLMDGRVAAAYAIENRTNPDLYLQRYTADREGKNGYLVMACEQALRPDTPSR